MFRAWFGNKRTISSVEIVIDTTDGKEALQIAKYYFRNYETSPEIQEHLKLLGNKYKIIIEKMIFKDKVHIMV